MQSNPASLYSRLGGYDAIAAMVDDLLPRLRSDELLSRFWVSPRSADTHNRERQLAVDFIAASRRRADLLPGPGHEDVAQRDGHHKGRLRGFHALSSLQPRHL